MDEAFSVLLAKLREQVGMGTVRQNFQRIENARAGPVEIGIPIHQINSRRIAPCRNLLFQQWLWFCYQQVSLN